MNKTELKAEIENLRFHRDMLDIMYKSTDNLLLKKEIRVEIVETNKMIRELHNALLDFHVTEIKNAYPQADAIYEDKIIAVIGELNFIHLHAKGKLQLCGCINGRRLYAL